MVAVKLCFKVSYKSVSCKGELCELAYPGFEIAFGFRRVGF